MTGATISSALGVSGELNTEMVHRLNLDIMNRDSWERERTQKVLRVTETWGA